MLYKSISWDHKQVFPLDLDNVFSRFMIFVLADWFGRSKRDRLFCNSSRSLKFMVLLCTVTILFQPLVLLVLGIVRGTRVLLCTAALQHSWIPKRHQAEPLDIMMTMVIFLLSIFSYYPSIFIYGKITILELISSNYHFWEFGF